MLEYELIVNGEHNPTEGSDVGLAEFTLVGIAVGSTEGWYDVR